MHSFVKHSLQDVTNITEDSVLAGNDNFLADQSVACSYAPRLDALCDSVSDILDRSMSLFVLMWNI